MKIVVVSRGWFPSVRGGSERFASRVAEELYGMGVEVVGVTRVLPGQEEPRAPHPLMVFEDRRPVPLLASFRFSRWAARVVNRLKPDAVVVNCYWGESSPLFINEEIPVIAVVHDVGLLRSEWSRRHRLKHFLRVQVLRRVVRKANAIVVPSESVKRDLVKFFGADPGKVHVLGFEGVDGPMERVHVENEWFDVVMVGRFAPNKGHLVLLEAFREAARRIPNAKLWLVGGRGVDPEHQVYLERVRREAAEINRELGWEAVEVVVDAPSVDPYYRLADVCVAPSLGEEGYGLTVAECMAYGKPVIASDVFQETGVASPERAYIFPRGDAEKLAELLVHVHANYAEALEKAEKGLEYAKQCSWKRVAQRILSVIDSVAGSNTKAKRLEASGG